MFHTVSKIEHQEYCVLQKQDALMYFSGYDQAGTAQWTSDLDSGYRFWEVTDAVRTGHKLNLSKMLLIRKLFQVLDIEIEQEIVSQQM